MLLAPAGTPQGVVDRLSVEVGGIVYDPAITTRLQDLVVRS
jgi:hypothetical protein